MDIRGRVSPSGLISPSRTSWIALFKIHLAGIGKVANLKVQVRIVIGVILRVVAGVGLTYYVTDGLASEDVFFLLYLNIPQVHVYGIHPGAVRKGMLDDNSFSWIIESGVIFNHHTICNGHNLGSFNRVLPIAVKILAGMVELPHRRAEARRGCTQIGILGIKVGVLNQIPLGIIHNAWGIRLSIVIAQREDEDVRSGGHSPQPGEEAHPGEQED